VLGWQPLTTSNARRGPRDPGGIRRIQVGCGPNNLLAAWWNVDIRPFPGIDEVADITRPWPWDGLDYVYGEHLLEHLGPEEAVRFLSEAIRHLRPGGRIRLSTPGLEFVWTTHFSVGSPDDTTVTDTYRANRAFHGWGHRFLYSKPYLEKVLYATGYTEVAFFSYGESDHPDLRGLERHGKFQVVEGWPSVWNVEAARPMAGEPSFDDAILEEIEQEFVRYVRAGH
jgi:predicted SAM-dependent methyltransferase